MQAVNDLILRGLTCANGNAPILAAPFDLKDEDYQALFSEGKIVGVIMDGSKHGVAYIGRWTDQQTCRLKIDKSHNGYFLYLGVRQQIGSNMLWELRRNNIQKLICLADNGEEFKVFSVQRELVNSVYARLKHQIIPHLSRIYYLPLFVSLRVKFWQLIGLNLTNAYDELRVNSQFFSLPTESFNNNKVILLCGSLGPGGAERQITYTACGLAERTGHDIIVASRYLEPPGDFYKKTIEKAGVSVKAIPSFLEGGADQKIQALDRILNKYSKIGFKYICREIIATAIFLHKERPGVVHCWMDATNVSAGIAAQIVGIPRIIVSGRSMAPDNFNIFQPYMKPGYEHLQKNGSPIFLNNSQAGADDYARWLGIDSGKIKVIHNGFDFPAPYSDVKISEFRKTHGIPPDALVLGSIMRFSEEKQPNLWIDTAKRVVDECPGLIAIAFGDGVLLEQMRTAVEKIGYADRIFLPGTTSEAFLAMNSFDLFLLTSRMEGLPNVLIEAQAMGVPVVTTAKGGMTETYIERVTGISAPDGSYETLARACLDLFKDDERRKKMGINAARHARKYFSIGQMIEKTNQTYFSFL